MRLAFRSLPFLSGVASLALLTGCTAGADPTAGGAPATLATLASMRQRALGRNAPARGPVMLGLSGTAIASPAFLFGRPRDTEPDGSPNSPKIKSSLYASEFNPSHILLYGLPDQQNLAPACTFDTGYVNGIGVNASGTLYVPQGSIDRVTTYSAASCSQTPLILDEPYGQPGDVAFSNNGMTYVLDLVDRAGSAGLVSVYKNGATKPSSTLTNSAMAEALGIAVDASNDVFVSALTALGTNFFIDFKNGKMPGKIVHVSGNSFVVGLEFDASQNLIAIDNGANAVLMYAPPYSGAPSRAFPTLGASAEGKLDSANKNLYVSDMAYGTVDVYRYPSGNFEYSIANGLNQAYHVIGVAVDPAAPN